MHCTRPPTSIYIDSIAVLLSRCPSRDDLRYLRTQCRSLRLRPTDAWGWSMRLLLHQPTPDALDWLAQLNQQRRPTHILASMEKDSCRLQQLDVAVHWCFDRTREAVRMQAWIEARLVHLRRRYPGMNFKGTYFSSRRRWPGWGWALYSDERAARKNDQPTCQLELRLRGSAVVSRMGLAIEDLPSLDLAELLVSRLRLATPNHKALARLRDRSEGPYRRLLTIALDDLCGDEWDSPQCWDVGPAQYVADLCRLLAIDVGRLTSALDPRMII